MSPLTDLRLATRLLRKDRAFSATVIVTLAVCMGANAALFSVVQGVVLRPLPIDDSDRVVAAGNRYPGAGVPQPIGASVPDYFDRLRYIQAFESQALVNDSSASIDDNGTAVSMSVQHITPSYFRVMRAKPAVGQLFSEADGEPGNNQKVVLGYGFWQQRFAGDRAVVGRQLRLDGIPHTIIGVLPSGFRITDEDPLWVPFAFSPEARSDQNRHSNNVFYVARLAPGATLEQAQAQIDALNAANLDRFPQFREVIVNAKFSTLVQRLQDLMISDIRPTLYLMWGGALFVLLIGCVNVANLVLARSRARLKELATRLALGAGVWRIARQLAVEHVLLTLMAALAGLGIGALALLALQSITAGQLPRAVDITLDAGVVAYTLGIAAIVGLVLGAIPALATLPVNLVVVLREEGRTGTSGRGVRALRRTLVVAQVAAAFLLLIGAGLLLASFQKVLAVDPGFSAERVLTAAVSLPGSRYGQPGAATRFMSTSLERLRALPGVVAAGATNSIPFGNSYSASGILAEGYAMKPGESFIAPSRVQASDGYFEAIGARLVAGRLFTVRDNAQAPRVAVIDERLARLFWPGQNPIGRRLYDFNESDNPTAITDKTVFITVVGVIAEMKLRDLTDGENLVGAYYYPLAQQPDNTMTFVVKTKLDSTDVSSVLRRTIAEIDSQLPVIDLQPMSYWLDQSLVNRRVPALLATAFGGVALLLSSVGLYGVLAYLVTQRTREIGIRVALGSSRAGIFQLVLREGLLLAGAGLIVGGAGILLLRRALEGQLFGIVATDPTVLLLVGALLTAVAVVACVAPARRATRINPLTALAE